MSSATQASPEETAGKRTPSAHVRQIAAELLALAPDELKALRKECRERLIPKPTNHQGSLPKKFEPEIKIKRHDRPFPMRNSLRNMGRRIAELHPAWVFAGNGPGILPIPMPSVTSAIMGPHAAEMMQGMGSAPCAQPSTAAGVVEASNTPAEATEDVEGPAEEAAEMPKEEAAQKTTLTIKLVAFEAAKKIAVVKEVRAMLGHGLKESKDLVESAPKLLKKNVPREEAETFAEKLRAAGAEVALE